mmetsp:Transcript_16733/g.30894  ORF Transcript_16733/g.30894 Transcript_16733/m.30894 type:complete len:327 (+) Transcript_16733:63-1043(+)
MSGKTQGLAVGANLDWYSPGKQINAAKEQRPAKQQQSAPTPERKAAAAASPASRAAARQTAKRQPSAASASPAAPPPPAAVPSQPAAPEKPAAPPSAAKVQEVSDAHASSESTWEVGIDDDLLNPETGNDTADKEQPVKGAQKAETAPETASGDKTGANATEEASAAAGAAGRALAPLEAARSVEEALKAKEKLAQQSVESAMMTIAERRKQLEEEQRKQLEKLRQEEVELQKLKEEVNNDRGKIPEVEALRVRIESIGRQMQVVSRDVEAKREVMRRATDAYVVAEEGLSVLRERKKSMEEEMLNLLLDVGKRRDEKLNAVLTKV